MGMQPSLNPESFLQLTWIQNTLNLHFESTYAKVRCSVSMDAQQIKKEEEPACGKVHDPAFKITENYFSGKITMQLFGEKWKLLVF